MASVANVLLEILGRSDDAEDSLEAIAARVAAVSAQDAEVLIQIEDAKAKADLLGLKAELATLGDKDIDIDVRRGLAEQILAISDAVQGLVPAAEDAGGAAGGVGVRVGALGGSLASLGPLAAVAVAALVALALAAGAVIAALAAMVASLAAAAAGAGALAIGLGAALLPAIAAVIAVISRITQGMEAQEQAEERLRKTTDAHRQAIDARKSAMDSLRGAQTQAEAADASLQDAEESALLAREALNQAYEDAERALMDLRFAATGAALSEKRASLSLAEAEKNLQKVLGDESATQLERRDARLAVQEAELALNEAKARGVQSQADLNEAEAKGIKGSDQVVAARRQLAEAQQSVAVAQAEAARANRGVLAAETELADAQRKSARTAERVADAEERREKVNKGAVGGLIAAWEAFQKILDVVGRAFDPVLRAIADGLGQIGPMLRKLQPAFDAFGGAVGKAVAMLLDEFTNPEWTRFFSFLLRSTGQLAGPLTRLFMEVARFMRDIAQASLPFVIKGFRALAGLFGDLREGAGGVRGIRETIKSLLPHLETWWNLAKQVARVVVNFFIAAAPAGKKLAGWITRMAEQFADWLASKEGQRAIRDFFEEITPLVKKIARFIAEFVRDFFRWVEQAADDLGPVIDAFRTLLGIVSDIADFLDRISNAIKDKRIIQRNKETGELEAVDPNEPKAKNTTKIPPKLKRSLVPKGVGDFHRGMGRVGRRAAFPGAGAVPEAAPAAAGLPAGNTFVFPTAPGHIADPRLAAAQAARRMRERGMSVA